MVDIEPEVFTLVASALRTEFGSSFAVYGETILAPSVFPCACIEEADNYSHLSTRDTSSNDNHANLMYEVNVYSNKANGKKTECKNIFNVIDGIMSGLGFTRNSKNPITMDDATKYRIFGRYSAIVSQNKTIYRR